MIWQWQKLTLLRSLVQVLSPIMETHESQVFESIPWWDHSWGYWMTEICQWHPVRRFWWEQVRACWCAMPMLAGFRFGVGSFGILLYPRGSSSWKYVRKSGWGKDRKRWKSEDQIWGFPSATPAPPRCPTISTERSNSKAIVARFDKLQLNIAIVILNFWMFSVRRAGMMERHQMTVKTFDFEGLH